MTALLTHLRPTAPFTERRGPAPAETCSAPTSRHDGLRVRRVVMGVPGRQYATRLCSGCLQVASELGVVTMDRRR